MANPILRRYSNNEDGYSSDPGITHDVSVVELERNVNVYLVPT